MEIKCYWWLFSMWRIWFRKQTISKPVCIIKVGTSHLGDFCVDVKHLPTNQANFFICILITMFSEKSWAKDLWEDTWGWWIDENQRKERGKRKQFTLNLCHEIRQEREPCHGQVEGWSWTTKKPVDLAYSNLRIIQLLAALSAMSSDNWVTHFQVVESFFNSSKCFP